jgi:cellulase (glycosyl hydrolase family 5)
MKVSHQVCRLALAVGMMVSLVACGFLTRPISDSEIQDLDQQRWPASKANAWYERQPWLVGVNFIPSTAINQLEMWQSDTFDTDTIDRELGWAAGLGMNVVRVYLHDLAWEQDPEGFKARVDEFLGIAWSHGIKTSLVLFDDVWNPDPVAGPQPRPVPGVHNSGWVQSPANREVNDPSYWPRLEAYVSDIVSHFGSDHRVLYWDLYNEPGNEGQGSKSLPLLQATFAWARAVSPSQPLTTGSWFKHRRLNSFAHAASDIITFHNYGGLNAMEADIVKLKAMGRPVICTEWMARTTGSRFETHLSLLKEQGVGAISWGLVSGKTQTIYPWGSPEGDAPPEIWFHDILHSDGTPYIPAEVEIIRAATSGLENYPELP